MTATRDATDVDRSPFPVAQLSGDRLQREQSFSLSGAIDRLAGVHNLTTGQQIGKPVIRGLAGARVLVLDDGHRLEDYSWSDEDGPSIDARLAQRVEVIRGPASVLYGSDAIGGVVNAIPAALPDASGGNFVRSTAELTGATNNREGGLLLGAEGAHSRIGWRATAIARFAEDMNDARREAGEHEVLGGDRRGRCGVPLVSRDIDAAVCPLWLRVSPARGQRATEARGRRRGGGRAGAEGVRRSRAVHRELRRRQVPPRAEAAVAASQPGRGVRRARPRRRADRRRVRGVQPAAQHDDRRPAPASRGGRQGARHVRRLGRVPDQRFARDHPARARRAPDRGRAVRVRADRPRPGEPHGGRARRRELPARRCERGSRSDGSVAEHERLFGRPGCHRPSRQPIWR